MRAHAFAVGWNLIDVSIDIVEGRLGLDEEGVAAVKPEPTSPDRSSWALRKEEHAAGFYGGGFGARYGSVSVWVLLGLSQVSHWLSFAPHCGH